MPWCNCARDNKLGTLMEHGGAFQTKLQIRRADSNCSARIPGLEKRRIRADWVACTATPSSIRRSGARPTATPRAAPHIRFCRTKVTGCEGYVESAAIGLVAGMMTAAELAGRDWQPLPPTTALGALLSHIHRRCRSRDLSAHECQFRPVSAPCTRSARKCERKPIRTARKADLARWDR